MHDAFEISGKEEITALKRVVRVLFVLRCKHKRLQIMVTYLFCSGIAQRFVKQASFQLQNNHLF